MAAVARCRRLSMQLPVEMVTPNYVIVFTSRYATRPEVRFNSVHTSIVCGNLLRNSTFRVVIIIYGGLESIVLQSIILANITPTHYTS